MFNRNLISIASQRDVSKSCKVTNVFQFVSYVRLFLQCHVWELSRKLSGSSSLRS